MKGYLNGVNYVIIKGEEDLELLKDAKLVGMCEADDALMLSFLNTLTQEYFLLGHGVANSADYPEDYFNAFLTEGDISRILRTSSKGLEILIELGFSIPHLENLRTLVKEQVALKERLDEVKGLIDKAKAKMKENKVYTKKKKGKL